MVCGAIKMKTLVVGMQSSGASFVTFALAQRPMIAIIDLYNRCLAPLLEEESQQYDIILKCTITATIPLIQQFQRFQPDRAILVTRDVDAIRRSLRQKEYRDDMGTMEQKVGVYTLLLLHHMDWFDEVISYERFVKKNHPLVTTISEVTGFTEDHSRWARDNRGVSWGIGNLKSQGDTRT